MNESTLAHQVAAELKGTGGWVRFASVMLFILVGLIFFVAIATAGVFFLGSTPGPAVAILVVYLLLGILYLYPARRLWGFSRGCKRFQTDNNPNTLVDALDQHRKFWKFFGVLITVVLSLYLLMIPLMVLLVFLIPNVRP